MPERKDISSLEFAVQFEGQPDRDIALTLYAFSPNGQLIAQAPVQKGQAWLQLAPWHARQTRLFVAPTFARTKPTLAQLEKARAYQPVFDFNPDLSRYELKPIPRFHWRFWPLQACRIRGRVVKPVQVGASKVDMPVCHARVHICEVDPWWLTIKHLPDDLVLRLRDELIATVWPRPPIPDPGPLRRLAEINLPLSAPPMPEMLAGEALADAGALQLTARLPAEGISLAALHSAALPAVKQALLHLEPLVKLRLCDWPWFWPFWRCDEVAVLETDEQGQFDDTAWFSILDEPDLYFWVEYCIGGVWTTVYRNRVACDTHFNYTCGSEVTIRVSDPRVPWCGYVPHLPGCQVGVLTIGNNESVSLIKDAAAGAAQGLTGDERPFGGSLEPHVWFGEDLAECGAAYYRWSYRRLGSGDLWAVADAPVVRHYGVVSGGDLTFLPYLLGPQGSDLLFEIPPLSPPAGSWAPMVDARMNTASAFFHSHVWDGATPSAGKYELKLELFDSSRNLINCTNAGITFKMPSKSLEAPFGTATVTTLDAPDQNLFKDAANRVVGFRLVVHVDNNPCQAQINPVSVAGQAVDDCGFVHLAGNTQVHVSFLAGHPHDFARFHFQIFKGNAGSLAVAEASGAVATAAAGPYTRVMGTHTYVGNLDKDALMGTCVQAAFAETLYVKALATDGWGDLTHLDRAATPKAFALAP